jgi:hypothetical protein
VTSHSMTLSLVLAFATAGCIQQILVDGQINGTRRGADAVDTIADYELAKSAAKAGLAQFEGMHVLSPKNEDALFLLTKNWVGYGFAFIDDERERADDDGNGEEQQYHQQRALAAYNRAILYGAELLSHRVGGFDAAKRNETTLKAWLQRFDERDDAQALLWTGYGYLLRADVMRSSGAPVAIGAVGELYIGVAMIERSVQLDPDYAGASGITALATYHGRPMVDAKELEQSRQLFDAALARTQRKNLMVMVNYARSYACAKGDKRLYESLLGEVLAAVDPDPNQRLTNTIARRRAKRYLLPMHEQECDLK